MTDVWLEMMEAQKELDKIKIILLIFYCVSVVLVSWVFVLRGFIK